MTDTRNTPEAGEQAQADRARRGDREAFLSLYEKYASSCWRLGVVASRDPVAAVGAVVVGFAQVLSPTSHNANPLMPVGEQLLHAVRASALEHAGHLGHDADLGSVATKVDAGTVHTFEQLPERCRSALWLHHVEGCSASTMAAALGCTTADASALATRALAGLQEQYAQLLVKPELRGTCRPATMRLGGYAIDALPSRDTVRVRRHLDRCSACRTRLAELDDVAPRLKGLVPLIPLEVEASALAAWYSRTHDAPGPFGLRLPNGATVPAWAERMLAGATAAAVAVGISAAVLLGTTSKDGNGSQWTEVATPAIGEQAMPADPGTDPLTEAPTVDAPGPSTNGGSDGPTARGADGSAPSDAGATAPPAAAPRSPSAPAPTAPAGPPAPAPSPAPTPSPTPSPAPAPPPPGDVDDVVGDVVDVVEDLCGGLGPLCPIGGSTSGSTSGGLLGRPAL